MDMFGPRNVHLMGDVHKWPMLDDRETWVPGPLGVPPMEAPSTSPESLSWAVPAAFWFHPHRTRLDLWANSTIVFFCVSKECTDWAEEARGFNGIN